MCLNLQEGAPVYNDAKQLEKFFDEQVQKFLPEYLYSLEEDDDSQPPAKKYKRIICED